MTDVSPLPTPKESSSKPHHHHGHLQVPQPRFKNHWRQQQHQNHDADRIDTSIFYDTLNSEFAKKLGMSSSNNSSSRPLSSKTPGGLHSLNQTFDLSSTSYGPKLLRLEAENQKLYEKLLREETKRNHRRSGGGSKKNMADKPPMRLTSSALNRQREQQRIEKENQLILRRLLDVKPSKDVQKEYQMRDYERNIGYLSLKMLPIGGGISSSNSSMIAASNSGTQRSKRTSAKSSANNSRISSAKSGGHRGGDGFDPHDVLKRTMSLTRRPEWQERW